MCDWAGSVTRKEAEDLGDLAEVCKRQLER
jgi:hypothetical protein